MPQETVRSRFHKVMSGQMPEDRLPLLEWAGWWHLTMQRWQAEGLPADLDCYGIKRFFGLDVNYQIWFAQFAPDYQLPAVEHGQGWVATMDDYEALRPFMYPDPVPIDRAVWEGYAREQARGEVLIWTTFSGFFWWPRTLFGIEPHLYAFYDQPELMHRMNQDQVAYILRCLETFCEICTPDFITFGEDLSYNHGPMLSKESFDEFIAPYYRQVIPAFQERGITTIIDSDGGIEPLVPWFAECGLEGILPLERMAGVDVNRLRANHPDWKMIGGYDKTVMHLGEEALRAEFERLFPAMRSGYFIPSVDHQTPPAVSIDDYRLYVRLLREYAEKACR
ncbi:MAG: uroporphyrinogen decarboxylase family protein [Armatimonadota bacterium]